MIGTQMDKKFLALYGMRILINVLTIAVNRPYIDPDQSSPHPYT